ncbi:MAG: Uma2 family endonuclease [Blautia sp.]|nr:Uma2 family endonuclease [Blautia sp.]
MNSNDKRYTIDDYYRLPDDQRVELIDGVFYDMGAPAIIHQMILLQLGMLFEECSRQAGVREYWIVDPKHRSVTVHDFSRIMKKIAPYYED